jgi:hypothetical protein
MAWVPGLCSGIAGGGAQGRLSKSGNPMPGIDYSVLWCEAMEKSHILSEIKRTTKANGGKPLGWRRFLTETGIRQSDWLGIHWARWSDALKEAGFVPNELTEGYEPDELLEKIALLTLALGRLPTSADLRLQAKNEPGFPSDKTFGRLGSKPQLVALLGGSSVFKCKQRWSGDPLPTP